MNNLLFKLSSIGYALNCDVALTNRSPEFLPQNNHTIFNLLFKLNDGDSVYISPGETSFDIKELIDILIYKNIKVNFYIMHEPIVDIDLVNKLLPYSNNMFLMNNIYDHPNIHNMPIGIRDCEKVVPNHKGFSHDFLFNEGNKNVIKEYLCLLCFSFSHDDRYNCYYTLKDKSFILNINDNDYEKQESIHCGKVPVWVNYEYTHKSHYALSPTGVGQATHRFFEAIYLDTIPIVKRTNTPFDKLYNIFPCLAVNDWNEVTEELLISNRDTCFNKILEFKRNYPNAFTDLDSIHNLLLLT
jgi:hypothetical protein